MFLSHEASLQGGPCHGNHGEKSWSENHDEFICLQLVSVENAGQKKVCLAWAIKKIREGRVKSQKITKIGVWKAELSWIITERIENIDVNLSSRIINRVFRNSQMHRLWSLHWRVSRQSHILRRPGHRRRRQGKVHRVWEMRPVLPGWGHQYRINFFVY